MSRRIDRSMEHPGQSQSPHRNQRTMAGDDAIANGPAVRSAAATGHRPPIRIRQCAGREEQPHHPSPSPAAVTGEDKRKPRARERKRRAPSIRPCQSPVLVCPPDLCVWFVCLVATHVQAVSQAQHRPARLICMYHRRVFTVLGWESRGHRASSGR